MISTVKQKNVTRVGLNSEKKFTIEASPKAFRVLSDGLYSNKIKAIIRELSCNAADAHKVAGTTAKPFVVHLPNELEPYFNIRDYGTGLSPEEMEGIYTGYFASDKDGSNEVTGFLGLGSKSPLCYTDVFTAVSYYEGNKYTYTIFFNEEGVPSIALIAEEKTDEHNGIEISFPVQSDDFYDFGNEASSVFYHFEHYPEIVGGKYYHKIEKKYLLVGTNWGMREENYHSKARAVMGNVSYSLSDVTGDLTADEMAVLACPLDIQFALGELEPAASREKLSYNKATIEAIRKRVKEVHNEIFSSVQDRISVAKNLWEARVLNYEMAEGKYKCLAPIIKQVEWNGVKLGGRSGGNLYFDVRTKGVGIISFGYGYSRRGGNTIQKSNTHHMRATSKTRLFIQDIDRGAYCRCKAAIENSDGEVDTVYLISVAENDPEILESFQIEAGLTGEVIPPVSSIEYKAARRSSGNAHPKTYQKILRYNGQKIRSNTSRREAWDIEDVDVENGGYYVSLYHYRVQREAGDWRESFDVSDFTTLMENMGLLGVDTMTTPVYGVKNGVLKKVEAHSEWATLKSLAEEKVKEALEDDDIMWLMNVKGFFRMDDFSWIKAPSNGPIAKALEAGRKHKELREIKHLSGKITAMRDICSELRIDLEGLIKKREKKLGKVESVDFKKLEDAIYKVYPMLELADMYRAKNKEKAVNAYVKMVDSTRKKSKKKA